MRVCDSTKKLMQTLMVTDGNEFNVEVDKPGMQHAKQRVLSFISHEDAAPFMRKDLYQILNSYVTQATRRAEWARRFGGRPRLPVTGLFRVGTLDPATEQAARRTTPTTRTRENSTSAATPR